MSTATSVREIAFSPTETLKWASKDGTTIEGWLTLSAQLRPRARAVSADRVQSRRPARGDRLQLRFQEAVLRRQRLLRARHELPQLDGYGDAFKWATWGAWGDKDGQDVIAGIDHVIKALPDRSEARRPHRPLVRRLHDELADHAVSGSVRRGSERRRHLQLDQRLRHGRHLPDEGDRVLRYAVGAGRARADDQAVAAHLCRQRQDADAVHPRRSRSARAVRGGRADVLRAEAARRAGEDDPLRRPAARHQRALEQRAPDAERAALVEACTWGTGEPVSRSDRPGASGAPAAGRASATAIRSDTSTTRST